MPYLEKLGFDVVGYGCTTCIGNSGPLKPEIEQSISKSNLLAASVLSGNRNFEGRIHPLVQANFLASPPLVVAYALAGTVRKDLTREPVGIASDGKEIFLSDLLPKTEEIEQYIKEFVTPEVFQEFYADVFSANEEWNKIECAESATYHWQEDSTYIQNPPYFDGGTSENAPLQNLRVLAKFGDSVTTDHISPAGSIALKSPAGVYLAEHDVEAKDFNSYGARRGNHEVMMRGTFGNIRIKNLLTPEVEGGVSKHFPTGEVLPIYDVAMKYKAENTGLIVLAGRDYGMGSSRDWAAKGTNLLGVKAVIAESFERIHRSNLVMMGILPLEFLANENAETLGLTGEETFELVLPKEIGIHEKITVKATKSNGEVIEFQAIVRFDSEADKIYYKENGILPMVVSKKVQQVVH
jgi:aconitate hydratase